MMEEIVVTEDDLRRLETRFGSAVRLMGSWNSDRHVRLRQRSAVRCQEGRGRSDEPRCDRDSIPP